MQRELNDSWNKICQCVTQATTDIAELNINYIQKASRAGASPLSETPRKPEDFIKFVSNLNLEAMKYAQDLSDIYLENTQEFSKIMGDIMRETQANASKAVKGVVKLKEKERV